MNRRPVRNVAILYRNIKYNLVVEYARFSNVLKVIKTNTNKIQKFAVILGAVWLLGCYQFPFFWCSVFLPLSHSLYFFLLFSFCLFRSLSIFTFLSTCFCLPSSISPSFLLVSFLVFSASFFSPTFVCSSFFSPFSFTLLFLILFSFSPRPSLSPFLPSSLIMSLSPLPSLLYRSHPSSLLLFFSFSHSFLFSFFPSQRSGKWWSHTT